MPLNFLPLAALLASAFAGPSEAASPTDVRRITSDGVPKYGITLCGDGSTAAWLEVTGDVVVVKAAATDASWTKEVFRYSNAAFAGAVKGPHYDSADTNYRLNLGTQKILFSRDGKRLVLQIDEFAQSRHHDYFLVLELPGGAARLVPPVLPAGMGAFTGFTNYNSPGVWLLNSALGHTLSEDGRFLFLNVKAFGVVNGSGKSLDALIALEVDAGKAVRVAGYQAMDAKGNLTPGEPEYAEARLSSSGGLVAFALAGGYWVGDTKGSPPRRVAEGGSNAPLLAADGQYVVETESGAFFPAGGGAKVPLPAPGRGDLVFPFWDGAAGFVVHPALGARQEVGIVRASGGSTLLRSGEGGLPAEWKFGVRELASTYSYQLASRDGRRVLLSMVGPDGRNDLFLAGKRDAAVAPAAPMPAAPPAASAATEASATVAAAAGEIRVTAAASPIRGFSIQVPAGAYRGPVNFTVSTAPPPRLNLPAEARLLTPLIRIENGGAFAAIPLTLTIPVQAPAGYAVLAFYIDEQSGRMEGLPLLQATGSSVTALASHFSSIVVVGMPESALPAAIDSGFKPGVDDWQMVNEGSFATPDGHCTGQSITAMWYYFEKTLRREPALFNRYDNNGAKDSATPGYWYDDSFAVRLISTVWRDLDWGNARRTASLRLADMRADRTMLNAFRLSIYLTKEPQLAEIFRYDAKANQWSGHAIVVYRVENDRLLVADPNFPGKADRLIQFDAAAGRFKPYFSAETANDPGVNYTHICYVAKTALIPWDKLGERWNEFERSFAAKPQDNAGIVGRDYFPAYKLKIAETQGRTELVDYFTTDRDTLKLEVESPGNQVRAFPVAGTARADLNPQGEIALKPGHNEIGVYVQGAVRGYWRWLDFRRFHIFRNTPAADGKAQPQPPSAPGTPPAVSPKPAAAAWLHNLKGIQMAFRADYVRSDGTRADGYEFLVAPDEADWYEMPIQWDGNTFRGVYERQPRPDSPGTMRMTVTGAVREAGPSFFLDLEARVTGSGPGGTTSHELKIKAIPMLQMNRMAPDPWLEAKRLEGDLVRDLAPTLVINETTRSGTVGVQSIDWKRSSLRVEVKRGVRKK